VRQGIQQELGEVGKRNEVFSRSRREVGEQSDSFSRRRSRREVGKQRKEFSGRGGGRRVR